MRGERGLHGGLREALRAPSEAAAEEGGVDLHGRGIHAERFGHGIAIRRLHLRAEVEIAAIGANVRQAVQRFHRRVREVRQLVFHVHAPGRVGQGVAHVAALGGHGARLRRELAVLLAQRRRGQILVRPVVPSQHQCFATPLGRPGIAAYTTTPNGSGFTSTTPGSARAAPSSSCSSVAPITGGRAATANNMPGSRWSRPNFALPSTFMGASRRFCGLPR
jgi:hypothetical protein